MTLAGEVAVSLVSSIGWWPIGVRHSAVQRRKGGPRGQEQAPPPGGGAGGPRRARGSRRRPVVIPRPVARQTPPWRWRMTAPLQLRDRQGRRTGQVGEAMAATGGRR